MSEGHDETLANIDRAIEDWERGPDVATWRADGSHEHDPASWTRQHLGVRFESLRPEQQAQIVERYRRVAQAFIDAMRPVAEHYQKVFRQIGVAMAEVAERNPQLLTQDREDA